MRSESGGGDEIRASSEDLQQKQSPTTQHLTTSPVPLPLSLTDWHQVLMKYIYFTNYPKPSWSFWNVHYGHAFMNIALWITNQIKFITDVSLWTSCAHPYCSKCLILYSFTISICSESWMKPWIQWTGRLWVACMPWEQNFRSFATYSVLREWGNIPLSAWNLEVNFPLASSIISKNFLQFGSKEVTGLL